MVARREAEKRMSTLEEQVHQQMQQMQQMQQQMQQMQQTHQQMFLGYNLEVPNSQNGSTSHQVIICSAHM